MTRKTKREGRQIAGNVIPFRGRIHELPAADNTAAALKVYQAANLWYRNNAWPAPYDSTNHIVTRGDARQLTSLANNSVHLVVTSPPYWTLKKYVGSKGQLGSISDYESFLGELDAVWKECERVLVPGGRICCVVGDVCLPRKKTGRHYVMPLHADIQVRSRQLGLDVLTPILWHKIANGITESEGNGAGFYGKPYQPNAIVKNDIEYILFMRKPGEYRKVQPMQKALSMLTKEEMQHWWRSVWTDIRGASTRNGHPAPYPVALAERLVKMFSFAGDTVLDPFCGTGTSGIAAMSSGRNSVCIDIEASYIEIARENLIKSARGRKVNVGDGHFEIPFAGRV